MRACAAALALLACGGPAPAPDAGADAGPPPGALRVWIGGPRYVVAGERTCFVAVPSEEVESVRWIWADDEPPARELEACRSFGFVGPQVIGVEVGARGMRASATFEVRVVPRPAEARPTSSSPILVHHERVWAVNPDSDTVSVLSTDPPLLLAEIPVGERPRTLAALGSTIAVACEGDGSVHLVDAFAYRTLRAVVLGPGTEPYGVIAEPSGRGFVVSLRGSGQLAMLGPSGELGARLSVGPEPRGLAMSARGRVLATRWRSSAEGASVYALSVLVPTTFDGPPSTVHLAPDVGLDSDTDNDGVLSFLDQIVLAPDGERAVIPALKANVVAGLSRTGAPLTSQTTARAVLGEVTMDPDGGAQESFRHSFDDLDAASAAVFSPWGDLVYVAMRGAQAVVIVDAFDFFTVASIPDAGEAPDGLALSADGTRLFVHAFLSRSVREYDVSAASPRLVGEAITTLRDPLSPEVLEGKRVFYRSRDPRMSRTSYLACASCHLDGEGDSLVWDFTQRGEGLRNTIELRGRAGLGHGPLHWSANFDEVQDFEHDIRAHQGGTGFLDDALFHADGRDAPLGAPKAGLSRELDALAAYLTSLDDFGASPRRRPGDPAWVRARMRGAALFDDPEVGCASCHAPPAYTDSALVSGAPVLHDVGTLGPGSGGRLGEPLTGLDTPTLRGLWRSAPYLHDGSAPTLRDVLVTRNAEDRHGRTSHLSEAQIADLVAFLESLE